jgi:uncharacterized lipoprotein YbaY
MEESSMIPRILQRLLGVAVVLAVPALAPWQSPAFASNGSKARITGSATYRERAALTPAAVFEATLEEESRTETPGKVIAKALRENPGQVPIEFEIAYDPRRIDPRRQYVVRARIVEHGRVRFTGEEAYPVLTHGHGRKVLVLMHAAPRDAVVREKSRAKRNLR